MFCYVMLVITKRSGCGFINSKGFKKNFYAQKNKYIQYTVIFFAKKSGYIYNRAI